MANRHFRVKALPGEKSELRLDPIERQHLQVLRLKPEEIVTIIDQAGFSAECIVVDNIAGVLRQLMAASPPSREQELHLLLGITKGPSMDQAIRVATECGATHIHPLILARSVATGDRAERWLRIIDSATKQCKRTSLPTLLPATNLSEALNRPLPDNRFIALPQNNTTVQPNQPKTPGAILIGPEGGLTPREIEVASNANFLSLSLGPHVLRASTAAGVAVAMLSRSKSDV